MNDVEMNEWLEVVVEVTMIVVVVVVGPATKTQGLSSGPACK
jgi:hypothetical protein